MDTQMQDNHVDVNKIGAYIRQIRDLEGMDRDKLAERSGVSINYLYQLENGHFGSPGMENVQAIAMAFGYDLIEFLELCIWLNEEMNDDACDSGP